MGDADVEVGLSTHQHLTHNGGNDMQAEHETTLRKLNSARAEIARAASCQASPQ